MLDIYIFHVYANNSVASRLHLPENSRHQRLSLLLLLNKRCCWWLSKLGSLLRGLLLLQLRNRLVTLGPAPRQSDSRSINLKSIHLLYSNLCWSSMNILNKTASFPSWNLHVGYLSKWREYKAQFIFIDRRWKTANKNRCIVWILKLLLHNSRRCCGLLLLLLEQ